MLFGIKKPSCTLCITKDFCDKDKKLHPELLNEANEKGVEIEFYTSLEEFIKEHATKIEYITKEWILESIDISDLKRDIETDIYIFDEDQVENYVKSEDKSCSNIFTISVLNSELYDFYVYEMADGSLRIEALFISELEVEYDTYDDELNFCYLFAHTGVHLIVEDKEVKEFEVSETYI